MTTGEFVLDPRLAADTAVLGDWSLSRVLLMNDRRYPWLILVPRRAGASEAIDLDEASQHLLWREVMVAAHLLKSETSCRKINIGALGNVVQQLHVHIVARNEGDEAWPGPVWGQGKPERYDGDRLAIEVQRYQRLLQRGVA